ncbi:MAG: hypothetical protein NTU61_04470 [Candidatus Altiarchaeota archaeon]|nr:hypothetical protein [Candidatus Altiarchaeota archaeon]
MAYLIARVLRLGLFNSFERAAVNMAGMLLEFIVEMNPEEKAAKQTALRQAGYRKPV